MNETRNKGFLRSYRDTILSTLFILGVCVYPNIAMYYNPAPAFEQTEILRGVIVHAQREHSHVLLELPDGRMQALDFPGDLLGVYAGKWSTFAGASTHEFLMLKGCAAVIRVDHLRWLGIPTNPRIWDLRCERFSISYEKLVPYYRNNASNPIIKFLLFATIFAALALVIRNDINRRRI